MARAANFKAAWSSIDKPGDIYCETCHEGRRMEWGEVEVLRAISGMGLSMWLPASRWSTERKSGRTRARKW